MNVLLVLALTPLVASSQVAFREAPGRIEILLAGKPFSNLHYGQEWAKPFLHPLRSTTGVVVTRGYPLEKIEGESQDHKWHSGLWYAHGDVNGVDFWRDLGQEKTGRMVTRRTPQAKANALHVVTGLVTPEQKLLGSVTEEFRFARTGTSNIVDVKVTVRADRGIALRMGDTEEGTFGLRLADEFREERGVTMTNSQGVTGRKIWGKRARWVDYSTSIMGEKVGVIVLDHPQNPKYPTYWHARHYGLCSANPFGEHDFEKDKTRDGSVTIPAGGTLTFRYRVVIHAGGLEAIDPEKLMAEFARSK